MRLSWLVLLSGIPARALMDHARASRDLLELDVFEANEIGRAFYAAYGLDIVGERLDEETGLRVLRLRFQVGTAGFA